LLVATAFAGGKDAMFKAYKRAMKSDYRLFAYGDALMII
jgi:S-adenosylmethionine:tRNA-ribosyltransferase-isomerase (queuine synthetase)